MTTDKFLLEIPELAYDRNELLKIFEHAKGYARLKGLKWRFRPNRVVSVAEAKCVVIQYGENMMLDPSKAHLSYNFLQHDYIRNIVERLNFSHRITPESIDMLWYRPGFRFEPHVDHYASATMMWPIIPEDAGEPIDFYYNENIKFNPGEADGFDGKVTSSDINHTHYYSTTMPAIFNSHWIHGIRTVQAERVCLRIRIHDSFDSIVSRYKSGNLINE